MAAEVDRCQFFNAGSRQLDRDLEDKLRNILLEMHEDPKGKAILRNFSFDRFVRPREDLYDSVWENVKFWESRP